MRDSSPKIGRRLRPRVVDLQGLQLTQRVVSIKQLWPEHGAGAAPRASSAVLLSLSGELDYVSGRVVLPYLMAAIEQCEHVCCDLLSLSFIDSHGVKPLVSAREAAMARQRVFWVSRVSAQVRTVLVYAGGQELLAP